MRGKLVLMMALMFVLAGMLGVTFKVQRVEAPNGAIHIKADGSVDPPTANITSLDNVTYTFTANINNSIVVERSNIIIDGDGYTLNGTGVALGYAGVHVVYVANNVTIQNVNIIGFETAIAFISCGQNKVFGNTITNNADGIWLGESMNNTISGNIIANNTYGVFFNTVFFTDISGNNITNNEYGIYIEGTSVYDNKFYHNYFVNNTNQVYVEPDNPNAWDDDYPSGGNYWSDFEERYPGVGDVYSGPYQNETGSDGIWDGPYEIDVDNTDRYPLVPEFPTWTSMLFMLIVLTVTIAIYKRRHLKTSFH